MHCRETVCDTAGMNKADPNAVVLDFDVRTSVALAEWASTDALLGAHAPAAEKLGLRRKVASDAFLALAVSWERFYSAWVAAAVNRAPAVAVARLDGQLKAHALRELKIPASALSASMLASSHLSLSGVRTVLDADGQNIVARSHKDMVKTAEDWLDGACRTAALSVTSYDFAPAHLARLVRNVLAHESALALKLANEYSRGRGVPPGLRVTTQNNLDVRAWRAYLFARPPGRTAPRVALFHASLRDLAARFRT